MPTQKRDEVLLKMLKTPPKPHGSDDIDALAAEMRPGSTDIKKIAKLAGQSDRSAIAGKRSKKD